MLTLYAKVAFKTNKSTDLASTCVPRMQYILTYF